MHEFRTLGADHNMRTMATDLQETDLLTRIESIGDLIALEGKYHHACLVGLRNRHRSFMRQNSQVDNIEEKQLKAMAFIELIIYIEKEVEDGTFSFKFVYLRQLYEHHLEDFGIKTEINKIRFKEKVLKHYLHAQEQSDGKSS